MTDLNELLERVKAATGPDRFLDEDIASELENGWKWNESARCFVTPEGFMDTAPKYTASTDAALALVERVLPGAASERTAWRGHYRCTLIETNEEGWHNGGKHFRIEATSQASEPIAILAALLSVLISKGGQP